MTHTRVARLLLFPAFLLSAACGSDATSPGSGASGRVRIVNSAFQFSDAASTPAKAVPVAIDVLIDSIAGSPSAMALPSGAVFQQADTSRYLHIESGAHAFFARLAGPSQVTAALFTNANNLPYVPHEFLPPEIPYTLIVAGIAPVTAAAGATQALMPATAFPFVMLPDDPFAPAQAGGTYQVRFRLINAAPFAAATGNGATVSLYLTAGLTAPASVSGLTKLGDALYRNGSSYFNQPAGAYVATVTVGTAIIAQLPLTMAAGEVRTFVLQSTAASATPGVANNRLTALLDAKY
jgi:hypothetical protein